MFTDRTLPLSAGSSIPNPSDAYVPDPKDPVFARIRDLIYQASGIYHSSDKIYLMAERCARRMKAVGVPSPDAYLTYVTRTRHDVESELRLLLNEMTIGETYMFRNPAQLQALRSAILPQLISQRSGAGPRHLRFWSAGCSTGEEPYTLAIFLLEQSADLLKDWTFEIVATDINDKSLDTAEQGIYGEYALRNVTQLLRTKYFTRCDGTRLRISDKVKSLIRFSRINLNDPPGISALGSMHVVFCCNVLIYFDLQSKSRVIESFYSALRPGGYLFLGQAESLFQVKSAFHLIHFPLATAYLKSPSSTGYGCSR